MTIRPATEGASAFEIGKLLSSTGLTTYDPGYGNTAACVVGDHLHRRRRGHPALPRLPDRPARREVDLPGDQLPADLRRAAEPGRSSTRSPRRSAGTRCCTRTSRRSSTASRATRTRCRCCPARSRALSTFYQDSLDPFDEDDGRAVDGPAAGQAAHDRGVRLQEVDGPAVPLPGQLAGPGRELPADDLRVPGRALRGRPGVRQGAGPAADPARRPRAELLDLDGAAWSARRRPTCSRRSRRGSTRCSGRCTAGRTRPCWRCCERIRRSRTATSTRSSSGSRTRRRAPG